MPDFSPSSKLKLATCHPDLARLFQEVVKYYNCTIIEGSRSDYDQKKAFTAGKSKLDGIKQKSKHQVDKEHPLARAVDAAPFPIDWKDRERFCHFAGRVEGVAQMLGIKITWGGDWDNDNELKDNKFDDLPHFELID